MRKWLVVVAVMLGACADKDPTGPEPDDITGLYTLETINGKPLPYLLINVFGAFTLTQLSGTMELKPNKSYAETAALRYVFADSTGATVVEDTTVVLRGQWEVEDSAIVLIPEIPGFPLFGLVARSTLTLSVESSSDSLTTYFYRRNANGGAVAGRPHVNYLISSSPSLVLSGSTTRLLTTTSSITGRRSTTTSSEASTRVSAARASTSRASSTTTSSGSSK